MKVSLRSLVLIPLAFAAASCSGDKDQVQTVDNDVSIFQPLSASHNLGLRGTKTIALTFDDGPNVGATAPILDYLKEEGVKATFFLIGRNVVAHPELVARTRDEGHTLANHSWSHPNMPTIGAQNIDLVYQEISKADKVIAPYLLPTNRFYFRPPEGAWKTFESTAMNKHPDLVKYIAPVKWDIGGTNIYADDSGRIVNYRTENMLGAADWECWARKISAGTCAAGYYNAIQAIQGGIVLMHDRAETPTLIKVLIPALKAQGYRFVTLDEIPQMAQFQ